MVEKTKRKIMSVSEEAHRIFRMYAGNKGVTITELVEELAKDLKSELAKEFNSLKSSKSTSIIEESQELINDLFEEA